MNKGSEKMKGNELNEIQMEQLKIIGKRLDKDSKFTHPIFGDNPIFVVSYMVGFFGSKFNISDKIEEVKKE